jgi:nucleotidyltransferase/DNA polymerase involved in DNA repair
MFAHVDADAFFASVLVRKDPRLAGKALLALGMGGSCVIAASYEAKALGVKTGMPLKEARKLAPNALAMQSDFDEACAASRQLEQILEDRCSRIEQASVDEWYADLSACTGGEPDLAIWASDVQNQAKTGVHLTVSVGIAPSKLLAKMASEYRKPAGCTIIGKDISIEAFLRDRPAPAIPGIGRRRNVHAESHGWLTAWDIAHAPADKLRTLFGEPGIDMQQELLGNAVDGIAEEPAPPKSVSRCRSFRAARDPALVHAHVLTHLSRLVLRMRTQNLACTAVAAWVRDANMQHTGADWKLPQPLCMEEELLPYVRSCIERCTRKTTSYTQAGLGLYGLMPRAAQQYSLFETVQQSDESEAMQRALDGVREQFGRGSVVRASSLPSGAAKKRPRPTVYGGVGSCR